MRDTTFLAEPALFEADDLMDVPVDQFALSGDAIEAVLHGGGPGFDETDIEILTAIAVANGTMREVDGELRRVRSFSLRDGVFTPVPAEPVLVPLVVREPPPVGKLSGGSH